MRLPPFIKESLDQDDELCGLVRSTLADFSKWIGYYPHTFFPEYTDHTCRHLERVLLASEKLIHPSTMKLMTTGDMAALTLSVLLHDCVMHLTIDGFTELILPNSAWHPVHDFHDESWNTLWLRFLDEANRFDGRQLTLLFGEPIPIRALPADPIDWREPHKKLIGEFLRRYHHILAHQIALYGVPGKTDSEFKLGLEYSNRSFVDLVGVISRSHGMNFRDCLDYIKEHHGMFEATEKKVHPVFLMALLRIADYLDIGEQRTPVKLNSIRLFRSPVSSDHHRLNQAVYNIEWLGDDPEAIRIFAKPTCIKDYVALEKLIEDIQSELDNTWAVLGEVYGNHAKHDFRLTLRRMKSNMNFPSIANSFSFIPKQAYFDINRDILNLLVSPLYGNVPEIGVRELLQNAVDAIWERRSWEHHNSSGEVTPDTEYRVNMSIEEDESGNVCFVIRDNGIGMNFDTVRDYFLKAGASFRRSSSWRRQFIDDTGTTKVLRSGRFGIGVLAIFLMGDKVYVETRHVSQSEGLAFSATLDTELIEIQKANLPVGTTIRVYLSSSKWNVKYMGWEDRYSFSRKWDWYCLGYPKVIRFNHYVHQNDFINRQDYYLPMPKQKLPSPIYYRSNFPEYSDFQWTHCPVPALVCNGIKVMDEWPKDKKYLFEFDYFKILTPNINVSDREGNLPLNLQRNNLIEMPFAERLAEDSCKDVISFLVANAPDVLGDKEIKTSTFFPDHCGLEFSYTYWEEKKGDGGKALRIIPGLDTIKRSRNDTGVFWSPYVFCPSGITLMDPFLLHALGISTLIFIGMLDMSKTVMLEFPFEDTQTGVVFYSVNYDSLLAQIDAIRFSIPVERIHPKSYTTSYQKKPLTNPLLNDVKRLNIDAIIHEEIFEKIKPGKNMKKDEFGFIQEMASKSGRWVNVSLNKDRRKNAAQIVNCCQMKTSGNRELCPGVFGVWTFDTSDNLTMSPLAKLWIDYFGVQTMPYNLEKRKERLIKNSAELESVVQYYQDHSSTWWAERSYLPDYKKEAIGALSSDIG